MIVPGLTFNDKKRAFANRENIIFRNYLNYKYEK